MKASLGYVRPCKETEYLHGLKDRSDFLDVRNTNHKKSSISLQDIGSCGTNNIAQQVKALATKPDPWDPHDRRRELTLTGCPLTSIYT